MRYKDKIAKLAFLCGFELTPWSVPPTLALTHKYTCVCVCASLHAYMCVYVYVNFFPGK